MVEINRTSHDEYGAKCLLVSVRFLNHGRDKLYGVVQVFTPSGGMEREARCRCTPLQDDIHLYVYAPLRQGLATVCFYCRDSIYLRHAHKDKPDSVKI
ncbi:hypothetical protein EMCRGX_G011916 [Ephydatia muelleri]